MYRRLVNINSEWSNFLSMEYGSNNSEYHSKPIFNDNLFSNRNKFCWLFTNDIGDRFNQLFAERYSDCIAINNLLGRIINFNSEWRIELSMEYRSDNSEH